MAPLHSPQNVIPYPAERHLVDRGRMIGRKDISPLENVFTSCYVVEYPLLAPAVWFLALEARR
jgi:hypothetical protein